MDVDLRISGYMYLSIRIHALRPTDARWWALAGGRALHVSAAGFVRPSASEGPDSAKK